MDKIAEKVGAWLLKGGNTKANLAKELGMSAATLNNRLSGETGWSWKEVCDLVEVLGCELSDFR